MLRQYGRRGTVAAVVVAFVTIFALLNILEPFGNGGVQTIDASTRIEETVQLEKETFKSEGPAEALLDNSPAAPEEDATKSEEQQQVEEKKAVEAEEAIANPSPTPEPSFPSREFPPTDPTGPSKVIVMGKMTHEDVAWTQELTDWQKAIYCVDINSTTPCPVPGGGLRVPVNKAKEAMPYLTYIIDHYDRLPDVMAFVHAHRNGMPAAWHNDAPNHDAVRMLQQLRTATVLERGYVNLRCITEIGCPAEVQPFRSPPIEDKHAEHAFPYFYAEFFNKTYGQMREEIGVVGTPCCAQFAVGKAEVLKRERAFYERVRGVLLETGYDDDTSGRVMEYVSVLMRRRGRFAARVLADCRTQMWHMIFGRDAVSCEDVWQCWCNVYGRCGLGVKHHWRA